MLQTDVTAGEIARAPSGPSALRNLGDLDSTLLKHTAFTTLGDIGEHGCRQRVNSAQICRRWPSSCVPNRT